MKRFSSILAVSFLVGFCATAVAQPQYTRLFGGQQNTVSPTPASYNAGVPTAPSSVAQANITSVTGNIPAVSTTLSATAPSTHWTIWTSPAAANMYVNFANGTATTSNAIVYPNASITITTMPISSIKVLGASASGQYNYIAY